MNTVLNPHCHESFQGRTRCKRLGLVYVCLLGQHPNGFASNPPISTGNSVWEPGRFGVPSVICRSSSKL